MVTFEPWHHTVDMKVVSARQEHHFIPCLIIQEADSALLPAAVFIIRGYLYWEVYEELLLDAILLARFSDVLLIIFGD